MGCDIHGWVERKVGNKWVAECELTEKGRYRDYQRFAALAGVRGDGPEPRGLPADIADTTKLHADGWGVDGHSHSWMPLSEATPIFLETAYGLDEWERKYPEDAFFGVDTSGIAFPPERRIVFWFDN